MVRISIIFGLPLSASVSVCVCVRFLSLDVRYTNISPHSWVNRDKSGRVLAACCLYEKFLIIAVNISAVAVAVAIVLFRCKRMKQREISKSHPFVYITHTCET